MKPAHKLSGRLHYLDWVRVLAFAFLIFYHTAMMFVSWEFHIESGHDSTFLKSIMILSSKWRLDILFLVSGVAISYMTAKMSLKAFTWQRVIKLYLPLIFGIAVVVAPQAYYEALQKNLFDGGFWQFWSTTYFTFTWDQRMGAPFPTYNHMWYVLYLFHYTILLLPLFAFINSARGSAGLDKLESFLVKGSRIVWLPLTLYFAIFAIFDNHDINHTFYDDWYGHAIFIFSVVLGVILFRMPRVWQAFEDNRFFSLTIGVFSYSALLFLFFFPGEPLPVDRAIAWGTLGILIKWSWISLIIGFAKKHLNYSNKALRYCNSVVYPFFILHQTIIIVIGYYIIDWGMSGTTEFFSIILGTFLICGLICELIIKKNRILRLLFGLP